MSAVEIVPAVMPELPSKFFAVIHKVVKLFLCKYFGNDSLMKIEIWTKNLFAKHGGEESLNWRKKFQKKFHCKNFYP